LKKFVFLYIGNDGDNSMEAWMNWFKSLGESVVDMGNPFGEAREGSSELDQNDSNAVTGYSIVNATSMEQAVEMTSSCPSKKVRVYECMPM